MCKNDATKTRVYNNVCVCVFFFVGKSDSLILHSQHFSILSPLSVDCRQERHHLIDIFCQAEDAALSTCFPGKSIHIWHGCICTQYTPCEIGLTKSTADSLLRVYVAMSGSKVFPNAIEYVK